MDKFVDELGRIKNVLIVTTTSLLLAIGISFFVKSIQVYILFLVGLILIFSVFYTLRKISKLEKRAGKIHDIIVKSGEIKDGNLSIDIPYEIEAGDEYNKVAINLSLIKNTNRRLLTDIENIFLLTKKGYKEVEINSKNYNGEYRELIEMINKSLEKQENL